MMPGPVLVATINRSARMGFLAGPLIVLGHAIIEAALVIAILMGLGTLLEKPEVLNPIMVGGGAMLVYLGVVILNEVRLRKVALPTGPEAGAQSVRESALRPVLEGIVTSASNPYWSLWWATIGLTYVGLASQLGPLGIPAFYSGHILSDLAWFSVIAAGVAVGTRHMTDLLYRSVLAGCSIFLVCLGTLFAYQGTVSLVAML
jgi:threonine/homoserine/homoserine lactone efflux protein